MASPHDTAKDQYLDAALHRVVGGESPPNLSAQILNALNEEQGEDEQDTKLARLSTQRRRRKTLGIAAAAACAVLGLGLIGIEYLTPQATTPLTTSHENLLFSDNAKYEIKDNTISLKAGWLLLSDPSLAVDTGTAQVQGVEGSLLISAGQVPDEDDLVTIQNWLQTNTNTKDIDMKLLSKTSVLLAGGAVLLSGSAMINGNAVQAQDSEMTMRWAVPLPQESQAAVDAIQNVNTDALSNEELMYTVMRLQNDVKQMETNLLKRLLTPAQEHLDTYGAYANKEDSGINRVLESGLFPSFANDANGLRGGGAYFSFTSGSNDYDQGPDIVLEKGFFRSGFYGQNHGQIAHLDGVEFEAASTNEVPEFMLHEDYATRFKGLTFRHGLAQAKVGQTYAIRSIRFGEADTLAVFKVIDKQDWGITFVWKVLKNFDLPLLPGKAEPDATFTPKITAEGSDDITVTPNPSDE